METDISPLFKYLNSGRIGRINSIFHKLSIEQLLEEFTQTGGISALSALFSRSTGGVAFMARDCRDVMRKLDKAGRMQR